PQGALPLLEKAVRLDPSDLKTSQHLTQAYRLMDDRAKAEQQEQRLKESQLDWERLTKLHEQASAQPWDDGVRCQIAELCLKLGRMPEARTWVQAALASNPASRQAQVLRDQLAAGPVNRPSGRP